MKSFLPKISFFALALLLVLTGSAAAQEEQTDNTQETAMGIQIETASADGFTMNYFKFGQGEKTMVILPGLSVQSVMGSAEAVAAAYSQMTEEFTVYLFDRRSELPDSYSVYDMARDTEAVFRALGLDHVYLFGASQGGMIAMDIAIHAPELIEKLVLGSTSACVDEAHAGTVENWIRLAKEGNAEGLYLAFGEAVYPHEVFEQYRQLLIDAAKTVTDQDLARFVILAEGMRGFDDTDDLGKITCPVLVIGDTEDRVLGAEASVSIKEHLNGQTESELFLYEGYGHAAYDTAPDYKDRMMEFYQR